MLKGRTGRLAVAAAITVVLVHGKLGSELSIISIDSLVSIKIGGDSQAPGATFGRNGHDYGSYSSAPFDYGSYNKTAHTDSSAERGWDNFLSVGWDNYSF